MTSTGSRRDDTNDLSSANLSEFVSVFPTILLFSGRQTPPKQTAEEQRLMKRKNIVFLSTHGQQTISDVKRAIAAAKISSRRYLWGVQAYTSFTPLDVTR